MLIDYVRGAKIHKFPTAGGLVLLISALFKINCTVKHLAWCHWTLN